MSSFADSLNKAILSPDEYNDVQSALKRQRSGDSTTGTDNVSSIIIPANTIIEGPTILLIRGFSCYAFNPATGDFARRADTIRDRAYFEAVNIGRKVYVISTFSRIAAGTVECYDIDTNRWQMLPDLPHKLRSLACTNIGNDLYVIGGLNIDTLERSKSVYVASDLSPLDEAVDGQEDGQAPDGNVASNSSNNQSPWTLKNSKMIIPRYRHAAVTTPDGKIWIAGGIILQNGCQEESFTATTEIYDPASDVWSPGPTMSRQRAIDIHLVIISTESDDGSSSASDLYAVGGDVMAPSFDGSGEVPVGSIEILDRTTNLWRHITDFPKERRGVSAAAVGSKIYLFGGRHGNEDHLTWDCYDLLTGQWASVDGKERPIPVECLYGHACVIHQ